ncbi:MAG: CYTH domain-containing protein [Gemmatimonadetes bacterium]|nr:CYTH domain-containing protein [Gemmatimonadota bacterium]
MADANRNIEIEHKFLITGEGWRGHGDGIRYRQGYIAVSETATVRIRIGGNAAFLTLKGRAAPGSISRPEFEYPVPPADAAEILEQFCGDAVVEKTRFRIPFEGFVWEVDEFHGRHQGLLLAEIELSREGETFERPDWVGEEVTGDYRYSNAWLAGASGP